jgi:hypothetical protein
MPSKVLTVEGGGTLLIIRYAKTSRRLRYKTHPTGHPSSRLRLTGSISLYEFFQKLGITAVECRTAFRRAPARGEISSGE